MKSHLTAGIWPAIAVSAIAVSAAAAPPRKAATVKTLPAKRTPARRPAPRTAARPGMHPQPAPPISMRQAAMLRSRLFTAHPPTTTDKQMALWSAKARAHPNDPAILTGLASAYLQKARETADVSYYARAEATVQRALRIHPDDYVSIRLRSECQLARHEFEQAVQSAQQAQRANPSDPINYGALGDSYIEIGNYDAAEKNFQKMVNLRPGRASYSRMSYLLELYGDDRNAIKMMRMAVGAGDATGEAAAWCHFWLGNLYFNKGFLPAAEQEYHAALTSFPGYPHAYAGLGRVEAARKNYAASIADYQKVLDAAPWLLYVGELADVYTAAGQPAKTKQELDLVAVVQKLDDANGMQDTDLQAALIDANHGLNLPHDLQVAQKQVLTRKNTRAWDALAWIAYLNGKPQLAETAMKQAMRLGTADSLMDYHEAKIQEALGNKDLSIRLFNKAIFRCPYFHVLYADDARRSMDRLAKSLAAETAARSASAR